MSDNYIQMLFEVFPRLGPATVCEGYFVFGINNIFYYYDGRLSLTSTKTSEHLMEQWDSWGKKAQGKFLASYLNKKCFARMRSDGVITRDVDRAARALVSDYLELTIAQTNDKRKLVLGLGEASEKDYRDLIKQLNQVCPAKGKFKSSSTGNVVVFTGDSPVLKTCSVKLSTLK